MVLERVLATDFGVNLGQPDCTSELFAALESCRRYSKATLVFLPGDYHFKPDYAKESYHAISNNSHGLKRCALPIHNFDGLTIEGEGCRFIMHGVMMGAIINDSKNITLRNLSIDWSIPFCTQGKVLASTPDFFEVALSNETPYSINNNALWFAAEGWNYPFDNFLEFDASTHSPAYRVRDNGGAPWNLCRKAEPTLEGTVRIYTPMTTPPKVGNWVILRAGDRHSPAFFAEESTNVLFENVTVHHAGGMGFIAQKCENITLRQCAVKPPSSSERIFSACADATHFVYCKGTVTLEDCLFEGQMDDSFNIHGIYIRVEKIVSNNSLVLRLMHESQAGVKALSQSDKVRFVNNETLLPMGESQVILVAKVNSETLMVTFNELPENLKVGDCVENLAWIPNVIVRGCTARQHRARGFLISVAGKVLVENNTISTAGSAIKISGDANQWFESGAVQEVIIQNNVFRDCLYCERDKAIIDIDPEISELGKGFYHRNIKVVNNRFESFDTPLLYARSVDGLTFSNNTVVQTTTYPPWRMANPPVQTIACSGVSFES